VQFVLAGETFQNNLLKADLYQTPSGGVKVTLYTGKPYNDNVVVNKKSDFEYVILMPETSNSLTAKPSLTSVADTVKGIEIKTQQYENQVKGYTKIVISTAKPVEITTQVQTLAVSDYKLSEKDYKELLSQSAKKATAPVKKEAIKSVQKPKPATIKIGTPVLVQKTMKKFTSAKKTATAKPVSKPVSAAAHKTIEKPQKQPALQQPEVQPALVEEKAPALVEEPKIESEATAPIPEKIAEIPQPVGRIQKYKNIIKNNLYAVLGVIFAIFVLLLLGARRMTKNINKQKEDFISHLEEKPLPVRNYSEKINDNMNWREKFQTYVEATQASDGDVQKDENIRNTQDLDELFADEVPDISEEKTENETISSLDELGEMFEQDNADEQDFSIEELLGEEEEKEEIGEEVEEENLSALQPSGPSAEEDEFIKSEFAIDDDKGFYLVDFEDATALVGHIAEEIFILKRFDEKVRGSLQARLDEKKGTSTSYMTKVGGFRGLVEVTPDNMNLLIEL